jgi:PAS domain S-box-containing protein
VLALNCSTTAHGLGPRTRRVYDVLHERITSGELAPGARLPSHTRLAFDFGVAPMTIRTVLARLEDVGLISREMGRGTFVRPPSRPPVLVVAQPSLQATLTDRLNAAGMSPISVSEGSQALAALHQQPSIGLVFIEIGEPELLLAIRRRWPALPVVAVASSVANLASLYGAPEAPVLTLVAPVRPAHIDEVLRLVFREAPDARRAGATGFPAALLDIAGLENLQFQAQLLEAVEQAVVATDPGGRIVYWNRAAERLYGWLAAEVLGRSVGEVIVAPELMGRGREIMERLRKGETWSGEFPVRRRDGSQLPVLVTDSPVRDREGNLVAIIGVAIDLSERKQAERDRLARADTTRPDATV